MRVREMSLAAVVVLAMSAAFVPELAAQQQRRGTDFAQEPACQTLTPASMGGAAPKGQNVVVMRYLGASNHEIAYRDRVVLFNAYYTRVAPGRPLGFTKEDVKKADAIVVGHAHGDHFNDVPFVAKATGAPVIGSPITAAFAKTQGIPDAQIVSVSGKGGAADARTFGPLTIEPVLGTHKENSPEYGKSTGAAFRSIMEAMGLSRTPEQQEAARTIGARDPKLVTEGTLGFLLTTEDGFRIFLRDASGEPTESEQALMKRIGRTDVAVISYTSYVPQAQIPLTLPLVQLYKPGVWMPTHHDDTGGSRLDTPIEPMMLALRDAMPETRAISPLYRTPVCFDTQTRDVFVGR